MLNYLGLLSAKKVLGKESVLNIVINTNFLHPKSKKFLWNQSIVFCDIAYYDYNKLKCFQWN